MKLTLAAPQPKQLSHLPLCLVQTLTSNHLSNMKYPLKAHRKVHGMPQKIMRDEPGIQHPSDITTRLDNTVKAALAALRVVRWKRTGGSRSDKRLLSAHHCFFLRCTTMARKT